MISEVFTIIEIMVSWHDLWVAIDLTPAMTQAYYT